MSRTTNRSYRYPARKGTQPGYAWRDIQHLAEDVDADMAAVLADILAMLTATSATVATSQTTTSTSYAALATVGPAVTVETGTSALVIITARMRNSGVNLTRMSVAVSGATTAAADDTRSLEHEGTGWQRASTVYLHTGLTAGSNTFTCQYKVAAGTGTFEDRNIVVIPLTS